MKPIKRAAALLLALLTVAGALAATGIAAFADNVVYRVDLSMDVPVTGTKAANFPAKSSTPHTKAVDLSGEDSLWYDESGQAVHGCLVQGKSYMYVIVIRFDRGYKVAQSTAAYLNGSRMVGGQAFYNDDDGCVYLSVTFKITIPKGKYIDKVYMNITEPQVGDEVAASVPTIATANVTHYRSGWATMDGSEYRNQFENKKSYVFYSYLRISKGYYVDSDTKFYLNGRIMRNLDLSSMSGSYMARPSFTFAFDTSTLYPYTDVRLNAWYTEGVEYCVNNDFMSGTSDVNFRPSLKLSRAQFVTILSKVDGADISSYTGTSFYDVATGKWFSKPIEWAYKNGFAGGTGNGLFSPNADVTRETLAQFLYTYSKIKGYDVSSAALTADYTDAGTISPWAVTAVRWALAEGLINGTSATTLSPKLAATRAQIATIIKNYYRNIVEKYVLVTFDAGEGKCAEQTRTVKSGSNLVELPVARLEGKIFEGWVCVDPVTGEKIVIKENTVLGEYARLLLIAAWADEPLPHPEDPIPVPTDPTLVDR